MQPYPRLLIAEDDALFRQMLRLMLHNLRPTFQLADVGNGQDAYVHYHQHGADLILTDDQMPVMSGTTLIQTLRGEGSRVPMVLLSSLHAAREAITDDPYTVFAAKPVLIADLLAVIDTLLVGERAVDR